MVTARTGTSASARERWIPLHAGAALLLATAAVFAWAVRTPEGQRADIAVFAEVQVLNDALGVPAGVTRAVLPVVLAVVWAALGARAVRHGWSRPASGLLLVGTSALLVPWLRREVLRRPYYGDFGYAENTFPSGHVAVTTALIIAIILVWPVAFRWSVVLVAAIVVGAAAAASVIGHAHRPSDVLGAVLLVGALACLIAVAPWQRDPSSRNVSRAPVRRGTRIGE